MKMLRFVPMMVLALPLAGCLDIPPEGTNAQMVANYDAAVATLGCTLVSDADYGAVEFQAGLTREQAVSITEYKLGLEQAVKLDNGGVRLTSGACAPQAEA